MNIQKGDLFNRIPEIIEEEVFSELLNHKSLSIKRIISKGQSSPDSGWYDQTDNEWVLVVKGEGKIAFEDGTIQHLKEGNYVNIPAHTRHKVLWTSPLTETIWLAIHYL